jgi:malate synthase
MTTRVNRAGLQVATVLDDLLSNEIIQGTGISADQFWQTAADVFAKFMPENQALLAKRESIQKQIDEWHKANPAPYNQAE